MNLIELSSFLQDESAAQTYLKEKQILREFYLCPFCKSEKIGDIRRNRMKCYVCKREWHKRKGSFLESRHISDSKFIALLKLYSLEFNIDQISYELALDRKTVAGIIFDVQRKVLPYNNSKINDRIILYPKGKRIELESYDTELTDILNNYMIVEFKRYKEFGSIYSFLMDCNRKQKGISKYSVLDSFISFTKMRLISYRGIGINNVLLYLEELVIKFNLIRIDYYSYVVKMLHF